MLKSFEAEFDQLGSCEFCVFMEHYIEVVNARSQEEVPLDVSLCPPKHSGRTVRIEIGKPIAWVVIDCKLPGV